MRNIWALCWVAGFAVLTTGCSDNRCETLCEWLNDCAGTDVDCSDESEIEECEDDLDDLDADCDDAVSEFTDCLDENENDCEDVEQSCQGEAADFLTECEGEI